MKIFDKQLLTPNINTDKIEKWTPFCDVHLIKVSIVLTRLQ
jgi:hypothetical protein